MPRKKKGSRRHGNKIEAYVRVAPGPKGLRTARFDLGTSEVTLAAWRAKMQDAVGKSVAPESPESLAACVVRYLATPKVIQMADRAHRTKHLMRWVDALGRDTDARRVSSAAIDAVITAWLETAGPATVRKRRGALRSFYVWLSGKGGFNPVLGTFNPKEPKPESRDLGYVNVIRLLAAMPTYRDVKRGTPKTLSLVKLRCAVIAYTGIPPGVLAQMRPDDLDWRAGTVTFGRNKGKGVARRPVPFTPDGRAALFAFDAGDAYWTGDTRLKNVAGPINVSFKRAAKRIGLGDVHLYDLRHTMGAQLYRVTRDLATVGRFLGHADGSPITARYAMGANADVDRAAAQAVGEAMTETRRAMVKAVRGANKNPVRVSVSNRRAAR